MYAPLRFSKVTIFAGADLWFGSAQTAAHRSSVRAARKLLPSLRAIPIMAPPTWKRF